MAFHPPASRQRQLAISARLHLTEDAVPSAAGTKSAWPQPVLEAPVIEAPVIEAPVIDITKLTKKALIAYAKDSGIELAEGASKTEILATLAATAPKA